MSINFSSGLEGYYAAQQQNAESKRKMLERLFPSKETRVKKVAQSFVNDLNSHPTNLFTVINGSLVKSPKYKQFPTREAAWIDFTERSESKRVKPNRAFFDQHYDLAKANWDKNLIEKLQGIQSIGQWNSKELTKAVGSLELDPSYYAVPGVGNYMPKSTHKSIGDYNPLQPGGMSNIAERAKGLGPAAYFTGKAIKNKNLGGLAPGTQFANKKKIEWVTNKIGETVLEDGKAFKLNKKADDVLKVAKNVYGKSPKTKAAASKTITAAISKKGISGVAKDIFNKYGYKKGALILGKLFGKAAMSSSVTIGSKFAGPLGFAADVAMWGWTAKDIYQIAQDLYGEEPIKEGASF